MVILNNPCQLINHQAVHAPMTQVQPQPQSTTMQGIIQTLPPNILQCNTDLNTSVRRELADIVWLLFSSDRRTAAKLAGRLFIDGTHAGVFMSYVYDYRDRITDIVFSPNYMGISIEPPRELARDYVIGVNDYSDGLFINGVNLALLHVKSGVNDCYMVRNGRIVVATAGDGDFREVFGYDADVLGREAVLTTGPRDSITYRVQGEVAFELTRASNKYIAELFREQVQRSIAIYMADEVMRLLVDHGFNPDAIITAADDVLVLIPGVIQGSRKVDRWVVIRKMTGLFTSILGEYFTVRNDGFGCIRISDDTASARVFIDVDNESRGITLRVTTWKVIGSTPTRRIYNRIMRELTGSVRGMLNNSERTDELIIGNHYIKVERGLPINFEYEPEPMLKPRMLRSLLITVSRLRGFLVTPRSLVAIEHPQHGVKHLRFDGTYGLRIRTTMVSDRYIGDVNAVVIRRLVGKARRQATTVVE